MRSKNVRNRREAKAEKLRRSSSQAYFWAVVRWGKKHWKGLGQDWSWRF